MCHSPRSSTRRTTTPNDTTLSLSGPSTTSRESAPRESPDSAQTHYEAGSPESCSPPRTSPFLSGRTLRRGQGTGRSPLGLGIAACRDRGGSAGNASRPGWRRSPAVLPPRALDLFDSRAQVSPEFGVSIVDERYLPADRRARLPANILREPCHGNHSLFRVCPDSPTFGGKRPAGGPLGLRCLPVRLCTRMVYCYSLEAQHPGGRMPHRG
jgi:hypothetical protein